MCIDRSGVRKLIISTVFTVFKRVFGSWRNLMSSPYGIFTRVPESSFVSVKVINYLRCSKHAITRSISFYRCSCVRKCTVTFLTFHIFVMEI